LGDALILPKRHPACRRREAQPGSCTERENLSLRCQGRHPGGAHHEYQSTDAEHRDGVARSRDEGSVMEPDRRSCLVQPSSRANRQREEPADKARPFDILKREVWKAFKHVKANQGAAGVDGQSRGSMLIFRTTSTSFGIGCPRGAIFHLRCGEWKFRKRTAARARWAFRR
jgi:hypothetical protein